MASKPYFDPSHKKWRMKWWTGPVKKWQQVTLGPHPGWQDGQKVPTRCPPVIEQVARKYRDLELQARHGVSLGILVATPLAEYLADYKATCKASLAKNSYRSLERIVRVFLEWAESRKLETLSSVSVKECRDYLVHRSEHIGYAGLKLERVVLSRVWKLASQEGLITTNPWTLAKTPGRPPTDPPPYWTAEEIAKLLAAIGQDWLRDVVIVGLNTGLRITALLGLEWRDVDLSQGVVRVRDAINKTAWYQVPISPDCAVVLKRRHAKRAKDSPLVFPGPQSGKRMASERTYEAIRSAVKAAGISDHGHYNHCLRHSFATQAVMRGVPLPIVQSWLGHKSIAMTMRYAHVMPTESHRHMQAFAISAGTANPSASHPTSEHGQ